MKTFLNILGVLVALSLLTAGLVVLPWWMVFELSAWFTFFAVPTTMLAWWVIYCIMWAVKRTYSFKFMQL